MVLVICLLYCLLYLFVILYLFVKFVIFYFFFFQKVENNRLKNKSVGKNLVILFFLSLLKIGSVDQHLDVDQHRDVDQHFNLVSPKLKKSPLVLNERSPKIFFEIDVLENVTKFIRKHLYRSLSYTCVFL